MMIDDDTLKHLLRINDDLLQRCKRLNEKRNTAFSLRLIPLVDEFTHVLLEADKNKLQMHGSPRHSQQLSGLLPGQQGIGSGASSFGVSTASY